MQKKIEITFLFRAYQPPKKKRSYILAKEYINILNALSITNWSCVNTHLARNKSSTVNWILLPKWFCHAEINWPYLHEWTKTVTNKWVNHTHLNVRGFGSIPVLCMFSATNCCSRALASCSSSYKDSRRSKPSVSTHQKGADKKATKWKKLPPNLSNPLIFPHSLGWVVVRVGFELNGNILAV